MADSSQPPDPDEEEPQGGGGPEERDWLEIVSSGDAHAILERLARENPLDLAQRCTDRTRAKAVLLDAERVLLRAAARIAYHAHRYDASRSLDGWIAERIDQAIEDLLREDYEEDLESVPLDPNDERYLSFATILRAPVQAVRRACVVFHALPLEERAAFWAMLIDFKPLDRYAAEARVPLRVALQRFERAVTAFCTLGTARDLPGKEPPERGSRR